MPKKTSEKKKSKQKIKNPEKKAAVGKLAEAASEKQHFCQECAKHESRPSKCKLSGKNVPRKHPACGQFKKKGS